MAEFDYTNFGAMQILGLKPESGSAPADQDFRLLDACLTAEFDPKKFLNLIKPESGPAAVDQNFRLLAAGLSKTEYRRAIDAIETEFLTGTVGPLREEVKRSGVREVKRVMLKDAIDGSVEMTLAAQTHAQIMLRISKAKGKDSSPFVKAFVRAAKKLTDDEYNSPQGLNQPMMAIVDAVAEEQNKPNAFRKKKAGNYLSKVR